MESSGAGQHEGDIIPHQDQVEEVIDDQLKRTSAVGVLPNRAVAAGANPTKAEYDTLVASHNSVLQVLRDAGLIPTV